MKFIDAIKDKIVEQCPDWAQDRALEAIAMWEREEVCSKGEHSLIDGAVYAMCEQVKSDMEKSEGGAS